MRSANKEVVLEAVYVWLQRRLPFSIYHTSVHFIAHKSLLLLHFLVAHQCLTVAHLIALKNPILHFGIANQCPTIAHLIVQKNPMITFFHCAHKCPTIAHLVHDYYWYIQDPDGLSYKDSEQQCLTVGLLCARIGNNDVQQWADRCVILGELQQC
jgi:hypothetical protein